MVLHATQTAYATADLDKAVLTGQTLEIK